MSHFIEERVEADIRTNKYGGRVVTRFPPEPNGYPHIGHAKSISVNFGLAARFGGVCHLRMDDTNPTNESMEYVESMKRDIRWLGFDWGDKMFYASDYYQRLYDVALLFIRAGKAYVDDLSEEEISRYRGTVTEAGQESPYRGRSVEENLRLFEGMQQGEFAPGTKVLRAKGDLANPNMKMRDPLMYRIKHVPHYRTGTTWKVYPFYDFAHCFSDAFEGITHSICTLEFENNRELYDWFLRQVDVPGTPKELPQQIEFARLAMDYTVMSKRKLLELVRDGHVAGWDDPRMPTISGMRRRGYTPEAIRKFCEMIGVARANSVVDIGKLEFAVREDLEQRSGRLLCVLRPLEVVIENWPEGKVEELETAPTSSNAAVGKAPNLPGHGRKLTLSRVIYIDRDDFMEQPPKDFHRLSPGKEVRLRFGYVVTCERVEKDASGAVVRLICRYDPDPQRKAKGIIHWVSAAHSKRVVVRLYDRLFKDANPDAGEAHFLTHLNPKSLETLEARIEPFGLTVAPGSHWQFERVGYFFVDPDDSKPDAPVFNRAVTLKDSWTSEKKDVAKAATPAKTAPVEKEKPKEKQLPPPASPALAAARDALAHLGAEPAALLTQSQEIFAYFDATRSASADEKASATWVLNEVLRAAKTKPISELPASGTLVQMIATGALSRSAAKQVFEHLCVHGGTPEAAVKALGLDRVIDAASLEAIVKDVLDKHPEERKKRKEGFLIGLVMKAANGQANPQAVKDLVAKHL